MGWHEGMGAPGQRRLGVDHHRPRHTTDPALRRVLRSGAANLSTWRLVLQLAGYHERSLPERNLRGVPANGAGSEFAASALSGDERAAQEHKVHGLLFVPMEYFESRAGRHTI